MSDTPVNPPQRDLDSVPKIAASALPDAHLYKAGNIAPPGLPGQMGRIDHYALIRQLNQGGMGTVYLARDLHADDLVVLKTLRLELANSKTATDRFFDEMRNLSVLRHSSIIQILDYSRDPNNLYFTMPYYEQGDLQRWIETRHPIPNHEVSRIALQIAAALAHAHKAGIIHYDIKPSNILLADKTCDAVLADFGLSRSEATNAGIGDVRFRLQRGTPAYMAPEAVRGNYGGMRGDLYGFGATLYHLLTGRCPYQGGSNSDLTRRILTEPPSPISELRTDAWPGLVRVIEKAMASNTRDRYQEACEIIVDLNASIAAQVAPTAQPIGSAAVPLHPRPSDYPVRGWTVVSNVIPRFRACLAGRSVFLGLAMAALLIVILCVTLWRSRIASARTLDMLRSFRLAGIDAWCGTLTGDWEGDGVPDLYLARDHTAVAVSTEGEVLNEHPLAVPAQASVGLNLVADVNNDGRDEAFLSWSQDSDMFINVIGAGQFNLMRLKAKGSVAKDPAGVLHTTGMSASGLYDLDGNGKHELLAILGAAFQGRPRGICCFDLDTQKMLWERLTATNVESVAVGDITGDGKVEIALGSYASANGAVLDNGTDDAHAYVHLVDRHGKPVWHKEMGGAYTRVITHMADLDGGPLALIVSVSATPEFHPQKRERGSVCRLDAEGRIVASYDGGTAIHGLRIARPGPNKEPIVIVVDRLGGAYVLNKDLTLRQQVALQRQPNRDMDVQIHAAEDLDGDGRIEIVLSSYEQERRILDVTGEQGVVFTYNHRITVLNSDLSERAQYELAKTRKTCPGLRVVAADIDHDKHKELIVLTDEVRILRLR